MSLPILTVAQMRSWETATWASGQTETEVIRRVGENIARCALSLTRNVLPCVPPAGPSKLGRIGSASETHGSTLLSSGKFILLLAGKGHNGDDARAAVPHLQCEVHCLNVTDPAAQLADLQAALARRPALIIDALFGIGLNRPLDEAWQQFINAVNAVQRPVLAVDVPSGLNADTGETFGAAIEARVTLTVGAPKIGLLSAAAWPFVGRLEVTGDVGLILCPVTDSEMIWIQGMDFAEFPPARPVAGHKGTFGHLAIVAGSAGFHGAAVLATHSAQRAHPGLVTLHTLPEAYWPVAAQLQGAMVRAWEAEAKLSAPYSAVLVGPGLAAPEAAETFSMVTRKLWRDLTIPVIVDASAMDWLPLDPLARGAIRVITPHPGEAARLLKTTPDRIQANRPQALREISHKLGDCWVVLKGHQTLIGRSSGVIAVNSSGNPLLAQGGSGDALAGYLAGLLAQPALQHDIATTLQYAVWQHGAAADQLSAQRPNWVVEEFVGKLGQANA